MSVENDQQLRRFLVTSYAVNSILNNLQEKGRFVPFSRSSIESHQALSFSINVHVFLTPRTPTLNCAANKSTKFTSKPKNLLPQLRDSNDPKHHGRQLLLLSVQFKHCWDNNRRLWNRSVHFAILLRPPLLQR